jgi:glycosyltransferase involved in cell wall biosynthesis
MKILQLIDTLHAGGAERVALNYANSLLNAQVESHICVTRQKGVLFDELNEKVHTHFLGKRNIFDLRALFKLIRIVKRNNIDIVHAHGSSWFFAVLCKIWGLKFKLIWHDHYGNSDLLEKRKARALKLFSNKIDGIISVNKKLRDWALKELKTENVIFLNNFINKRKEKVYKGVRLKGNTKYNLICVANLRPQKDHFMLLEAFKALGDKDVSLHLIGKNYDDQYSKELIKLFNSTPSVFWYGEKENVHSFLYQADIGVLSSVSEGLPLALLEYAMAGLGVVCTDVGECQSVINGHGKVIRPHNFLEFAQGISVYLNDPDILKDDSQALKKRINQLYSEDYVLPQFLSFCNALC